MDYNCMLKDLIIILVVIIIVSGALYYIYKNKNCKKCIGCHLSNGCNCKASSCSKCFVSKK